MYYLPVLSWMYVLWEGVRGINDSFKCLRVREEIWLAKTLLPSESGPPVPNQYINDFIVKTHG